MSKSTSLSIDGWQLDSNRYRISRDGVEKKLEPRSMELLLYLAERHDEVVTRQQIEDDVWQGRIVGYDALSGSIAKIRRAFDDNIKYPRVIETIPKSGYRLIATVLIETEHTHPAAAKETSFERKLTVILYADVAEYSRLTGEDEDRTHRQLRENMTTISDAIVSFHGRIVHYAGDAVLAEFSTASMALNCALEVQQKASEINSHLAENRQVLFRIGVNLGGVIVDGNEIYGDGVNVAARLESLAQPGGVCISGTVFEAIGNKQNFDFEYLGEKNVKNIERPIQTYAVHLSGGATIPGPDPPLPSQVAESSIPKSAVSPLQTIIAVAVVVSLLVIGIYVFKSSDSKIRSNAESTAELIDPASPSLVILPFRSMSNDPEQKFYSDGLTDDLITDLSNVAGLHITPRHSSILYGDKNLLPIEIAEELRIRYVVQGSVRRSFQDIRVNIQMIDTHNNQEVWTQRFDDNIENVFKLQDHIIGEILKNVGLESDQISASTRRTTNLEAYDYFLRAEHRRLNDAGLDRDSTTIELYQRAIELDPSYVTAYTGLAREALTNWQQDANQIMPAAASKKLVYDFAGKALELEPNNAEALAILGLLQAISGVHDAGIESIERAVAIDPTNPQLHVDLAKALSYLGHHQEALKSINLAFNLHATPPSAYFAERAKIHFFLGQLKSAIKDSESTFNVRDFRNFSIFIHGALDDNRAIQHHVNARLSLNPWENQEYYRIIFAYYRRPEDIELIVNSAARAGIPGLAYGFDPGTNQPLDNRQISELTSKNLWHGATHSGDNFFQQFTTSGRVAIRTTRLMMSGNYHIEDKKLCVKFRSVLLDSPDCGPIYLNEPSADYTWVTLGEIYRFTVED